VIQTHDLGRRPTKAELRQARRRQRERFSRSKRVAHKYERQLRGIASEIGRIVNGFAPKGVIQDEVGLRNTLRKYSELIEPWARNVAASVVAEAAQRDETKWIEAGRQMGRDLKAEIQRSPTGRIMQKLMDEQVTLIKSLPLEASERVHALVIESLSDSTRASEIAKQIMASEHVTKSRATLIARTESARSSAHMMQARAQTIGCTHYIWHTAGDSDVREMHKELNNKTFAWDEPPIIGANGERGNPGTIYNCRCWAEPIIPDNF
jgi:SPP1 gp7 family putative phage head morphogenesis protein